MSLRVLSRHPLRAAFAGFCLWWACLATAAWCQLSWEVSRTRSPAAVTAGELAYLAWLVLCTSSPLAALGALGDGAKRTRSVWYRRLFPVVACLAVSPAANRVASELAAGDGVVARGWTTWVRLGGLTSLIGVSGVLAYWAIHESKRIQWWVLGAAVALGSLFVWLKLDPAYGFLAPFAIGYSSAVCATMTCRALEHRGIATPVRTAVILVAIALAISANSEALARGRAGVLKSETSARLIDGFVYEPGPAARAVEFSIPALGTAGCRGKRVASPWKPLALAPEKRRNVILITMDGLRADVLEHVEGGRPIMPNLLHFRQRAVAPERAYSPYPATLLAMGSALTGFTPRRILLAPSRPRTLFERARGRVEKSRALLPDDKWYRLDGFQRYVLSGADVTFHSGAARAVELAEQQLKEWRERGASGLLWVHLNEAHTPYRKYPGFDFGDSRRQKYLSGVAAMDAKVGELVAYLERNGWFDDSLIMIFADHGESLGERSYYGHHVFLDRWLTDVPFLLSFPGAVGVYGRAGVVRATVQLSDVMVTALHFLGAEPPTEAVSGVSLLSEMPPLSRLIVAEAFSIRGETIYEHATKPVPSVSELAGRVAFVQRAAPRYEPKVSLIGEHHRLIVHRTTGVTELFRIDDTSSSPRDLSSERPDIVQRMLGELVEWQRSTLTECLNALTDEITGNGPCQQHRVARRAPVARRDGRPGR